MAEVKHVSIDNTTYDIRDAKGSRVYYGTCPTAASTMPKVITVEDFPTENGKPLVGTEIVVKYSNTNSSTSTTPQINVNNTGDESVWYNNAVITSTKSSYLGYKNRYIRYMWDGTYWVFMGYSYDTNSTYSQASLGQGYAEQSNSAAATAITASISSYALAAGGIVSIKFAFDVPANATLNISSKGAKAIYNRGAAITAGVIKAGDTATFIYSTYYHLISIDRDKMERIVINATESNGALTFTDDDNNALTHAQVRVILNNLNNHVLLRFRGSEFTKTIGDEDWWEFERQAFRTTRFVDFVWANSKISIDDGGSSTLDDYYVPIGRTINNKVLSSNITLTASDVGALPASTTIPSKTSDLTNDSGFTSNAGTITGITMNGASKGTSGVVDLGTVITSHQDISGKANSADLATVATSGSYNDLQDKPNIPAGVTVDSTITQNGTNPVQGGAIYSALETASKQQTFLTFTATYDGDDIASGTFTDVDNNTLTDSQVRALLADANKDIVIQYGGKLYKCDSIDSEGSAVFSSYQYFSRRVYTLEIGLDDETLYYIGTDTQLVPQTRTVNGKALSSDITLNASDVGAMAEATVVEVSTAGAVSQALSPNTFYKFTGALTSLTLTLTAGTGLVVYAGKFTTGSGWGSSGLSVPSTVTAAVNNDTVSAGHTYEFSIMDNVIVIKQV